MATAQCSSHKLSIEPYLSGENDGQVRHRLLDGHVVAMAGASERHGGLKRDVTGPLNVPSGESCRVFDGGMKRRADQSEDVRFHRPDIFVAGSKDNDDTLVRGDAVQIIEVLAPTTERTDRLERVDTYTSRPILSEDALIEQDVPRVALFGRRTGIAAETFRPGAAVTFESISQTLTLDQIYRRIRF